MEQPSALAHIGVKGVEYMSCAATVDQADCSCKELLYEMGGGECVFSRRVRTLV